MMAVRTLSQNMIVSVFALLLSVAVASCTQRTESTEPISAVAELPAIVPTTAPLLLNRTIKGDLVKRMVADVHTDGRYAKLSVYAGDTLLVDSLNVVTRGDHRLEALVQFDTVGDVSLRLVARDSNHTVNGLEFEDVVGLDTPRFRDASADAGIDKASSIKYGGPTIADLDMDGDYDLIVNNHNAESSKIYWNNGDGTVVQHDKNLSRWFMHDLHGTAAGDYDGDGDLDLILFNESSLAGDKPQHFFYDNQGDGTFQYRAVAELEDMHPSRMLVTDFNGDNIDDIILYGPVSLWQGRGDFTFMDVTSRLPEGVSQLNHIMAVADLDIDMMVIWTHYLCFRGTFTCVW